MLDLVKSFVATFISLVLSLLSFIKGPILIGLLAGASILAFANQAEAKEVKGTKTELINAENDVKRGIYVNEVGSKVSKPDAEMCFMYRNTLGQYQRKFGNQKGARIWVVIVTRRGC